MKMKKVLVLGSGALKIGEAGEFDYSGSQALKALKQEGVETVLVNPNIATIQTSKELASKVYFLPVTPHFVERIIGKEKPDGILLGFGGQTALNCGLVLHSSGVLKKHGVKVLGSPISAIKITEDRQIFAESLKSIDVKVPNGGFAKSLKQALKIGKKLGFPLIVRSGFSLGGLGSSIVHSKEELQKVVSQALKLAPQVSVEEYLKHWKEIEYEVVRDKLGNKITVCNMENLDPLGVHTGESIVVAPSQTLNNYQYHFLRQLSLKVIEHLGIVGECNIQFALNPINNDYRVIEVNARLSRSSALASKATGYPLAYIAAKLALGYDLLSLRNSVTKTTSAFFEPSLDYIVVKIPRWDLQKFIGAHYSIGSEMKSVGEVMAIGRSFPEALQKGIRSLETDRDGLLGGKDLPAGALKDMLSPSTQRLFAVGQELANGTPVSRIYEATGIDPWFLNQLLEVVHFEHQLRTGKLKFDKGTLREAKRLGFSDKLIAESFIRSEKDVRQERKRWGILPKVKHIDTLAAEYPAKTNYLYLTYNGSEDETPKLPKLLKLPKVIVLGSGPYRIGSSVEFDWCSVTAAQTFRKKGLEAVIINCNPETVSTDFDSADKLYFEELSFERVQDVYDIEQNAGLVLAFGGQIPNNLAVKAYIAGMKILGTDPMFIDAAENRHKFSAILDTLDIDQPVWQELRSVNEASVFAKKIGFPVVIRPSYVLSGSAMNIAYTEGELQSYLKQAADVSPEHPVVISKFVDNAKEIEIDGVAQNGQLVIYALSEHIENAGVHSGDATLVLPPQKMFLETMRQIKTATRKIIEKFEINGPFNIQFMAKDNKVMVIELNLRSSRSFPFVSKVTGYNFVEMACLVMLNEDMAGKFNTLDLDYVGIKASQFSFNRIKGADPKLRVEMSSTGEVACFGEDLHETYLKALLSTGFKWPKRSVFLSLGGEKNKVAFLESAKHLADLGLNLYATEHTSEFLTKHGLKNTRVYKISEDKSPSVVDLLKSGAVDLMINLSVQEEQKGEKDGFIIRRNCVDLGVPLITNLQAAIALSSAMARKKIEDLEVKSWDEYI
ncbi:MAG: carbamoyl-phosphate synthase (glutamine-hydrolyzing) large subunit [Patescibacteria group bacterium]|nr:carbamoyl-phosphate synthase (glutamine-hydrolyzing) large subunit [Patescibacteria group bacterium]